MTTRSSAISAISRQLVAADQHRAALAGEVGEHVADPADAFGVEAVGRLVEDDRVRVAEQHAGEAEALPHAQRVAAHPVPPTAVSPTSSSTSSTRSRAMPFDGCQPAQVVASAAAGVHVAGVEQRAHLVQRRGEVAVAAAVERGGAGVGPVEPEHAPHGGALARAVGPEEAGDHTGTHLEREVVDGDLRAEALGEVDDRDHRVGAPQMVSTKALATTTGSVPLATISLSIWLSRSVVSAPASVSRATTSIGRGDRRRRQQGDRRVAGDHHLVVDEHRHVARW